MIAISAATSIGQQNSRRLSWGWRVSLSVTLLMAGLVIAPQQISTRLWQREDAWGVDQALVRETLAPAIQANRYLQRIVIHHEGKQFPATVHYTLDLGLQDAAKAAFEQQGGPDYGVFAALDPDSGRILALVSHRREADNDQNLALRASYPAASVFKIVTAAAAVDLGQASAATELPFNGKTTSLYRRNVLHHRDTKWTRRLPLKTAFAKSVNTVFGRLGLYSVGGTALADYASRFGFGQALDTDLALEPSVTGLDPADDWSVVETAAGYTRTTTLSPVHGALLAASAANGGHLLPATLVDTIVDDNGLIIYDRGNLGGHAIISPHTAAEIRTMLRETVQAGSARSSFAGFFHGAMAQVEVGGKTGSLSGLDPQGRYDWFVGYATAGPKKLAYAALCINRDFWYVKSAFIARKAIEHYFGTVD
ncbi:MAG: penicillin-binding transpeptidase domain-containing protein [Arenicellales bacterium]|nr:penicillin-binding transpeptidase domain-containing protein [Arenicellales bacterium]